MVVNPALQANGEWSLFCPNEAPGLADCWGEEFEALYSKYEHEGRARKTIKAQQLWFAILEAQVETGNPFMLYKDSANRKSNQQNLGTIKSSNLCTGAALGKHGRALSCTAVAASAGTFSPLRPPCISPETTLPQRSSSTAPPRRLRCATWLPSRCRGLCAKRNRAGATTRSWWALWMRRTGATRDCCWPWLAHFAGV